MFIVANQAATGLNGPEFGIIGYVALGAAVLVVIIGLLLMWRGR